MFIIVCLSKYQNTFVVFYYVDVMALIVSV